MNRVTHVGVKNTTASHVVLADTLQVGDLIWDDINPDRATYLCEVVSVEPIDARKRIVLRCYKSATEFPFLDYKFSGYSVLKVGFAPEEDD